MKRFNGILYGTMATLLISSGAAMAQDDQQQPEPQKQELQKQQEQQEQELKKRQEKQKQELKKQQEQQKNDGGATIKMDRKAPEIEYTPAKPKVSVTVPPPKVTVNQPPPQIEVTMPEPDVQIEQQDPKVEVEMGEPDIQFQGQKQKPKLSSKKVEPEINVKREGKPQIKVHSSDPEVTVTKAKSKGSQQQSSEQQTQNLMAMTGKDLKDKSLMDSEDKEVGTIKEVVLSSESQELFAVVKGDRGEKVLPVSDLELSDQGDVKWSKAKDELQQAKDYKKQQYKPIVLDRRLKEFN